MVDHRAGAALNMLAIRQPRSNTPQPHGQVPFYDINDMHEPYLVDDRIAAAQAVQSNMDLSI
jgi:hypothetical protein